MLSVNYEIKSYNKNGKKEEKTSWNDEEKKEHKFEYIVWLIDNQTTKEKILDNWDSSMETYNGKRLTYRECMDSIETITLDVKEGNAEYWFNV